MPASQKTVTLFSAVSPLSATNESTTQQTFGTDHVVLEVDFTLGSLTSCDVNLQFAHWNAGEVWDDVYDAQGTQVQINLTADADAWYMISSPTNNTRMAPVPIATREWRIQLVNTGTVTSSAMTMRATPFSLGSVRE